MRRLYLVAVLLGAAQAFDLGAALPACAEEPAANATSPSSTPAASSHPASRPVAAPKPVSQPPLAAAPSAAGTATVVPSPPDPVVTIVRTKFGDAEVTKGAHAEDIAALRAFYGARTEGPLWITEMGFSARGQQVIFEIEKADDWGLEADAFELPMAGFLPANQEEQALAEIRLDLAILKYARFARGGRFDPLAISELFDQKPPLRDPKSVLIEIGSADAPDAYLQSLHPQHDQFGRLRKALLEARKPDEDGAKPASSEQDIKRLIMNMERWRWVPDDFGTIYVWHNTPEFMVYVVKDGKIIYEDKTLVGTIDNATPAFSADMATIVFNPEWIAPKSVLLEKLLPNLRKKRYSLLKKHRFSVSYNGKLVNVAKIDWNRVDILDFTFIQKAGPGNNLGKVKFLYPNRHDVYMHDTVDFRRKYFKEKVRDIGYGCVRMEKPDEFAQVLLAESKGWPASQVKELWESNATNSIALERKIPVHTTYFTATVDEAGKVATYPDLYGLDHKQATAMFGDAEGFPMPPPKPKRPQAEAVVVDRSVGGIAGSLGFLD